MWYPALQRDSTCEYIENKSHKNCIVGATFWTNPDDGSISLLCCVPDWYWEKCVWNWEQTRGVHGRMMTVCVKWQRDVVLVSDDVRCGNMRVYTSQRVAEFKDWYTGGWFVITEPVIKLSKLPCGRYSNQGTVQFGSEMFASKCVSKCIKIKHNER